jgi:hypothetical protein
LIRSQLLLLGPVVYVRRTGVGACGGPSGGFLSCKKDLSAASCLLPPPPPPPASIHLIASRTNFSTPAARAHAFLGLTRVSHSVCAVPFAVAAGAPLRESCGEGWVGPPAGARRGSPDRKGGLRQPASHPSCKGVTQSQMQAKITRHAQCGGGWWVFKPCHFFPEKNNGECIMHEPPRPYLRSPLQLDQNNEEEYRLS